MGGGVVSKTRTHFPESLQPDILNAVGLTLETTVAWRKRDPAFRQRVLKAYEYRCAVCGFDVRLGTVSIALGAAYIRWHQAGNVDNSGLYSVAITSSTAEAD